MDCTAMGREELLEVVMRASRVAARLGKRGRRDGGLCMRDCDIVILSERRLRYTSRKIHIQTLKRLSILLPRIFAAEV
jgi:hypothetical protein